ncbi:MAG: putative peptidase family [Alphaproteobacteria bacterium]|nr:putative peptidase family [Alphaproteobacteria bacterium]
MTLKHQDIWRAIDLLAESHGLSASGLAKLAGLDPTSFNPSKRSTTDGRARWPSTETLSKIFQVTGEDFDRLPEYLRGDVTHRAINNNDIGPRARMGALHKIPLLGCAQAGQAGFFDDAGFPVGQGWEMIEFPKMQDSSIYALEVSGESMEPLYRDGDILIVSPHADNLRRGDRVVVKTRKGEVMAKQLNRLTQSQVTLKSLNTEFDDIVMPREQLQWVARILWVSQ